MKKIIILTFLLITQLSISQDFTYDEFFFEEINRDVQLVIYQSDSFRCGRTAFDFRLKKHDPQFSGKFFVSPKNAEILTRQNHLILNIESHELVTLVIYFIDEDNTITELKKYELGVFCESGKHLSSKLISQDSVSEIAVPPPSLMTMSPKKTASKDPIILFPDVAPSYPNGDNEMQKFIDSSIVYPVNCIARNEEGKVYLSFVVDKDGSIKMVKIERGICDELNYEAKRIVRSMPLWNPGIANGKAVRTRPRIVIEFVLPSEE